MPKSNQLSQPFVIPLRKKILARYLTIKRGLLISVALWGVTYPVYSIASNSNARLNILGLSHQNVRRCDNVAFDRPKENQKETAGNTSNWKFTKALPSRDGDVQLSLVRQASFSELGFCPLNTSLVIFCKKSKTEIGVDMGIPVRPPFGPDGGIVFLTFGTQPMKRHYFLGLTDSTIRLGRSKELVRDMLKHDTLKIEYRAFDSSKAVAKFDLRDLSEAIKNFTGYCEM